MPYVCGMNKQSSIDFIDTGHCINNTTPYSKTYCECYKISVPYAIFGQSGVLMFCREWVDYVMCYHAPIKSYSIEDNSDAIRRTVLECIKQRHPEFNNEHHIFSPTEFYSISQRGNSMIKFQLTPAPFQTYVSISAESLLRIHLYEGMDANFFTAFSVYRQHPNSIMNKMGRKMIDVCERNYRGLSMFCDEKRRVKKYSKLIEEILKKINTHEKQN